METGLTAIGTRYVFRRSRARKLELYFLVRTKSPIDKKNLPGSMVGGGGDRIEYRN